MGNLNSSYKKAIFDEIANNIASNTSQYYAFASNPIEYVDDITPALNKDVYSTAFELTWNMLFGKKITENDIMPVIKRNMWVSGTVYDSYDNTSENLYERNNYYVIVEPGIVSGDYHIYICIGNANGSQSTIKPNIIQTSSFLTEDGYEWRYITTISNSIYNKFATADYFPVYANNNISINSEMNSGVDSVIVTNGGSDYSTYYSNGTVRSVSSTRIKIDNNASDTSGFYTNCAIYLYNNNNISSQLLNISRYDAAPNNNFVYTETQVNTSLVSAGTTKYSIAPRVVFETDGTYMPSAIATVDPSSNSISSISVFSKGANVSWANVQIVSNYGSGASAYAVVPPPGGYGKDPASELNIKGYCVSFKFDQTDIPFDATYNKVGIVKNPYIIGVNAQKTINVYKQSTFKTMLVANVTHTFTKGDVVKGSTSKARGIVAFANSSQVYIVGDKNFSNGEFVSTAAVSNVSTIKIVSRGNIYTKDLFPLYSQNINNVTRQENQSESFKLIIKL